MMGGDIGAGGNAHEREETEIEKGWEAEDVVSCADVSVYITTHTDPPTTLNKGKRSEDQPAGSSLSVMFCYVGDVASI